MNKYSFNPDNDLNIESQIIWQYENAERLKSLITQKQSWYFENQTEFWHEWAKNVLNISTANDYGLSVWGLLLKVPRTYEIDGVMTTLGTEQYRLLLCGRLLYLRMNGSIPDINEYLNLLFKKDGVVFVRDNLDMTITYVFDFNPTQEDFVVLLNTSVLPKPAGVGYNIYILPNNDIFGFDGSDWVGFDQAPFWDGVDISKRNVMTSSVDMNDNSA